MESLAFLVARPRWLVGASTRSFTAFQRRSLPLHFIWPLGNPQKLIATARRRRLAAAAAHCMSLIPHETIYCKSGTKSELDNNAQERQQQQHSASFATVANSKISARRLSTRIRRDSLTSLDACEIATAGRVEMLKPSSFSVSSSKERKASIVFVLNRRLLQ